MGKLGEVGPESLKLRLHQAEHLLRKISWLTFFRKVADRLPPDSNKPLLLRNTAAGCF
jgi:hypothetical protein